MYDVAIIGAGIVGACIAREISKYNLKTIVIEKENDVANGTTKANSAIIHAGYDAKPGTKKAKFNVEGNALYEELCKELNVPFKRLGSYVVAFDEEELDTLNMLKIRGIKNGVKGLEILSAEETLKKEPNLSNNIKGALYAPSCGIVSPFELCIALCENAVDNGVSLRLNSKVTKLKKERENFKIYINNNEEVISSKFVINCAGIFSDYINNLIDKECFKIQARRGEYFILDKTAGKLVNSVIFQCPTKLGKGVLVTPTVHGNMLIGPNAEDIEDRENVETTFHGLETIKRAALKTTNKIPFNKVITSFSGLRATSNIGDFIIEESKNVHNFINVGGIESPGLTAAPAISKYIVKLIKEKLNGELPINKKFNARREVINFMSLNIDEKNEIIKKDSRYGKMICLCEQITEGEIVEAIHRSVGGTTVDGIKRRLRPGMGKCQGGFCMPKVMKILERELNLPMEKIQKDSLDSNILVEGLEQKN